MTKEYTFDFHSIQTAAEEILSKKKKCLSKKSAGIFFKTFAKAIDKYKNMSIINI